MLKNYINKWNKVKGINRRRMGHFIDSNMDSKPQECLAIYIMLATNPRLGLK